MFQKNRLALASSNTSQSYNILDWLRQGGEFFQVLISVLHCAVARARSYATCSQTAPHYKFLKKILLCQRRTANILSLLTQQPGLIGFIFQYLYIDQAYNKWNKLQVRNSLCLSFLIFLMWLQIVLSVSYFELKVKNILILTTISIYIQHSLHSSSYLEKRYRFFILSINPICTGEGANLPPLLVFLMQLLN